MNTRLIRWGFTLSLLAFRPAAAADYLADFSQFPAYPYNTVAYMQGGAYVGCGPTTGAMMFAYFQSRHSLTGLLTGPGTGVNAGLNTAWALHGQAYMKTQADGFGDVKNIKPGLEQYAADRGFSLKVVIHVGPAYSDPNASDAAWLNAYGAYGDAWMNDGAFWVKNPNGTWTIDVNAFCDFMTGPMTQGIPVFLTIDSNGDGGGDHWVALVGFDRSAGRYAFYNTVDASLHWGDIYYCGDPAGHKANSISMVRTVELVPGGPDISVDWTAVDFGAHPVTGDHPVQYLTVTNEGTADLAVSSVTLGGANPGDFTILNGAPFTLMPGNGRQVGVRFNPASAGEKNALLILASNDPDESPLTIALAGTGTDGGGGPMQPLSINLGAGTVNDLAALGTTLIAATETGGVFVSTDHGNNWNPSNSGLTNSTVRCLLVDGTELFAGTWGDGVFRSTDHGANWTPASAGLSDLYVTSLAIDPPGLNGAQRMLAGTWGGVFISADRGGSWTEVNAGLTETHVRSVMVSGPYCYAGTINGLFRSSDLGQTWATVHNGLTNTAVISLERRAGYLFAGTDGGGILYSENDGDLWAGFFLNTPAVIVPDLKAFDIGLVVATWGAGAFYREEGIAFGAALPGIAEFNIRSVTAACVDRDDG
ncbi:MAG: choice-of-anchor D domain-containing protein, partial [bacterium]|nr:choice-of-anchor D domain-containing protein [bacterium]